MIQRFFIYAIIRWPNSPEVAIKYPVRFVESGPAGGGQASS